MGEIEEPANTNIALENQQTLLESCLPTVFSAYDEACREGMSAPVVFLLDCEDEIGGEIARNWLGAEIVDQAVEQQHLQQAVNDEASGETTVFAYAFPLARCRKEVPEVFPYLGPVFEKALPEDSFLTIAVTSGGASALTVPLSARESS